MWKRFGVLAVLFLFLLIFFLGAGPLLAACGVDPPVPPGGFTWPVDGEITQGWTLDCESDRGHRGIDISAASGSLVKAAATGTVSFIGYTPAEGGSTTVTIDHEGGLRTTYLHIAGAVVSKGQTVSQGETIGLTDGSPFHLGIKLPGGSRDTYFNPLELLPARETQKDDSHPAPSQQTAPSSEPVSTNPGVETGMEPSQSPQASQAPLTQVPQATEMHPEEAAEPSGVPHAEAPAPVASPADLLSSERLVANIPPTRRWTAPGAAMSAEVNRRTTPWVNRSAQLTAAVIGGRVPAREVNYFSEQLSGATGARSLTPEIVPNTVATQKIGKKERGPVNLRDRREYIPTTFSILLIIVVAAGLPAFLARQAKKGCIQLPAAGHNALLKGLRF